MRLILLFIVFISSVTAAFAQDLTGIWRGHFKSGNYARLMDSLAIDDRYKFETQINQTRQGFEGVTYSYKTTVFYGKASCFGTISPKTKKVLLGETKLLEVKSEGGGACLMTCFLQYSKVGDEEFLEGSYTSISVRDSTQCGGGTVFLRKVDKSDFYEEPFLAGKEKSRLQPPVTKAKPETTDPPVKKTTPPAPQNITRTPSPAPKKTTPSGTAAKTNKITQKPKPSVAIVPEQEETLKPLPPDSIKKDLPKPSVPIAIPRVLSTRENEIVQTITSSSKEILIKIYDNGTIDNDTVSVYVDKKLVISRQRLTENALTLKINLNEDADVHELVMVAENLGEIPPNTSLMVVTAGDQQHEVRITSTEQKNAVVRFRYQP